MESRYYMGKYLIGIIERVDNKSYVYFLEDGFVGNEKMGFKEVKYGEKIFVFTRCCWKKRKEGLN